MTAGAHSQLLAGSPRPKNQSLCTAHNVLPLPSATSFGLPSRVRTESIEELIISFKRRRPGLAAAREVTSIKSLKLAEYSKTLAYNTRVYLRLSVSAALSSQHVCGEGYVSSA
jgi:hypothetical protein